MKMDLTAALVQMRFTADHAANRIRTADTIRAASRRGARLVVLPELHAGPYFCQVETARLFDLAETIPGPSTDFYTALAAELGIVLVISLFERRGRGFFHNTAVVIDRDGTITGKYRKMHIPDDPGFYEKYYFAPGDLGFQPITTSVGKLGVLVCWDQWYPEAARLMALAGADILIYPTAIGWLPADSKSEQKRQHDAWITVQRGHAVANGIPVLSVNRVGYEPAPGPRRRMKGLDFWGSSFACGPQGEILARASSGQEKLLLVKLDMARSETVRRLWPFFRDRRIDAYGDILKRYRDSASR